MSRYADSSFPVSCYIADGNTTRARDWLSRTGERLVFTALHALEVRNAFKLGIFRGLFSTAEAAAAQANLDILHVAAAKALRASELVSFDERQGMPAAATGLRLAP